MRTEYCTIGSIVRALYGIHFQLLGNQGTQSSRLRVTLYAYSLIIHPLSKASPQFSHCELFSWYNEAHCEGSSLR